MKPIAALADGAVMVALAVGGAPLASAIPNQDNSTLCPSIPAYAKAAAHFSDCESVGTTIGEVGHDTVKGLPQTFYPLAVPTMTAPKPPPPQDLCATPTTTKPPC